jgi:hypothetical protein
MMASATYRLSSPAKDSNQSARRACTISSNPCQVQRPLGATPVRWHAKTTSTPSVRGEERVERPSPLWLPGRGTVTEDDERKGTGARRAIDESLERENCVVLGESGANGNACDFLSRSERRPKEMANEQDSRQTAHYNEMRVCGCRRTPGSAA